MLYVIKELIECDYKKKDINLFLKLYGFEPHTLT